jgi:hypothetical protein
VEVMVQFSKNYMSLPLLHEIAVEMNRLLRSL